MLMEKEDEAGNEKTIGYHIDYVPFTLVYWYFWNAVIITSVSINRIIKNGMWQGGMEFDHPEAPYAWDILPLHYFWVSTLTFLTISSSEAIIMGFLIFKFLANCRQCKAVSSLSPLTWYTTFEFMCILLRIKERDSMKK